jgi:membrane associated rhomboid family serine protease
VECSNDAAVGQKCPECAAPEGRHRVVDARTIRRVDRHTTPITYLLIGINVIIFLLGALDVELERRIISEGAQHPFLIDQGEWWRVITATFLHGNVMHIAFNMWALWLFGPALERRYGSASFAALYLASGISGGMLYHLIGRDAYAVGASGAIFGLFGGLIAATFRQRHTLAGRAVFSQLLVLLAINLLIPFVVPNVAWEAHVGGLVAGLLIAGAWDNLPYGEKGSAVPRVVVALVVALIAIAAVIFV